MSSLFVTMVRFLLLPLIIESVALWLKGGTQTGGGFSAAVVAALAVLLYQMAHPPDRGRRAWLVRRASSLAAVGLTLTVASGIAPLAIGAPALSQFPPINRHAPHFGILELRTQVLFELGIALTVFGFVVETTAAIADLHDSSS